MTIDLFLFVSLVLIGFIYIFKYPKKIFYFYFLLLVLFIVTIRIDPKGVDFDTYKHWLNHVEGFAKLRETAYFLMSRTIYEVVHFFRFIKHDEIIAFIVIDFVWIYMLFRTQLELNKKYNENNYALVVILFTSFPLFFGYENIYRQLFAEIFALYAYVIRERSETKSNLTFLIAILMHNTALVVVPFLLMKKLYRLNTKNRFIVANVTALLLAVSFSVTSKLKSGHDTGLDLSAVYLLMFLTLFYVFFIKNKFNVLNLAVKFPSIYFGSILMVGLIVLPVGMVAERMGMFFLVFVITDLYVYSCRMMIYRQLLFRIGLLLGFSLPVLIFSSSRNMLLVSLPIYN